MTLVFKDVPLAYVSLPTKILVVRDAHANNSYLLVDKGGVLRPLAGPGQWFEDPCAARAETRRRMAKAIEGAKIAAEACEGRLSRLRDEISVLESRIDNIPLVEAKRT